MKTPRGNENFYLPLNALLRSRAVSCDPTQTLSAATMTARRQENKGRQAAALGFAGLFALAAGVCWNITRAAATTERVVVDRFTGLAIAGYDPVAYFTDRKAEPGFQSFEASQGGVVWRFRSDRNRIVFLADPDIYGPQFGGYDPVDLARGKIIAGRPNIWLIAGQRLYLFSRIENKDTFSMDPTRLTEAADKWPALSATLANY
jgi:hypothetical protein